MQVIVQHRLKNCSHVSYLQVKFKTKERTDVADSRLQDHKDICAQPQGVFARRNTINACFFKINYIRRSNAVTRSACHIIHIGLSAQRKV